MLNKFMLWVGSILLAVMMIISLFGCAEVKALNSVWLPTSAAPIHWQWQIGTPFNTSTDIVPNVTVYDIDGFDTSAATVAALHAQGCIVIAYFSFGTAENWRPDYSQFTSAVKGSTNGWPGENWLDIRSPLVQSIMSARMDLAVSKGFDAIEPDNIDGYSNSTGFSLTASNQLTYNEWIATTAHAKGLSVGLKNDIEQIATLQPYFDWCINEESYKYSEYSGLSVFINNNKAVFECEYGTSASQATVMNNLHINSMTRDLNLVSPHSSGYVRMPCIPDTQNIWTGGTTTTTSKTTTTTTTTPIVTKTVTTTVTTTIPPVTTTITSPPIVTTVTLPPVTTTVTTLPNSFTITVVVNGVTYTGVVSK